MSKRACFDCLVLLACLATAQGHNHQNVSVCVPETQTSQQLAECTRILGAANTEEVQFQCSSGRSADDCFRLLGDGTAALTVATGEEVFTASLDFGIIPILGEGLRGRDDNANYYSVAVVNTSFCEGEGNKTLADLRGLRSSHTGYGRTAGWDYPVGSLLASEAMQQTSVLPDVADDAESIVEFFSAVCAPRASSGVLSRNNLPVRTANGTGEQFPGLCTACRGSCDASDNYWSYEGVVRALMEGAADVGFTNNTAFINYTSDGNQAQSWSTRPSSDFRLLCRGGGCANITEYRNCHLAKGPSRAIVASPTLGQPANGSLFTAIQDALITAAQNATFVQSASNINDVTGFFLGSGVDRLTRFNTGLRGFFERDTLTALQALNQIPTYFNGSGNVTYGRMAFCVGSTSEREFCQSVARLLNTTDLGFGWNCRRPLNTSADCAADVAAGHTDAVITGASGLYTAYRDYELRAVAAEDSGSGEAAQYYSVAVVNQSYCDSADAARGFAGLAGKSMCSTGYGRTAGWVMPLGYLAENSLLDVSDLNSSIAGDAQVAARYFSNICAAGNNSEGPLKVPGSNRTTSYPPLCTACRSPARCSPSDAYWDYEGAFHGLVAGTCAVAMTRNGIVQDYSQGGRYAEDWAPEAEEYRLLCPGGGCRSPDEYADCTAAKVPSRTVAVRPNFSYVRELQSALETLVRNPTIRSYVFSNTTNPNGYLFQNNVQRFVPVETDTLTYLGSAGRAIQSIASLNANSTGIPVRSSSASAPLSG